VEQGWAGDEMRPEFEIFKERFLTRVAKSYKGHISSRKAVVAEMLLVEIAEQYAESAMLIDRRIKELEAAIAGGTGSSDMSVLNKLKQVRGELRRLERACRMYYERGYWLDEEFRAYQATKYMPGRPYVASKVQGGKRGGQSRSPVALEKKAPSCAVEIDRHAADLLIGALFGGVDGD